MPFQKKDSIIFKQCLSLCIYLTKLTKNFVFIFQTEKKNIIIDKYYTCYNEWNDYRSQAPASLLEALEQHLATLEGRKYVPSTPQPSK